MHPALTEFIRSRSPDAFRQVVAEHVDAVYAQCRRRLDDPAAAEDATQAVFVLLAQHAPRLRAGTVLGGWLYVTAQNVCLNARRSAARRRHHEREAAAMRPEVQAGVDAGSMWRDVRAVLDDAIASLGGGLRDAVVLRFLEGRSMAEVAAALGISEEAARQRVSRAVRSLRDQLAGRGVAVPAVALPGLLEAHIADPAPAALADAVAQHALAAPVAATPLMASAGLPLAAAATMAVVAGIAAISAVIFAGQAVPAARPSPAAPTTTPAPAIVEVDPATLPTVEVPAELVGVWRLTTPDELVPRVDGKRLRLLPVVVRDGEIVIETQNLDPAGPRDKRLLFRVIATKPDGTPKGLDAQVVDALVGGEPEPRTIGVIAPLTYEIDADGLLHLNIGKPGAYEAQFVLRREPPTTRPG